MLRDEQPDLLIYWDGEAGYWVAVGGHIKGIVLSGTTLALLGERLDAAIPILMEANGQKLRPMLNPGQPLGLRFADP